ncbi:protein FAM76B [Drosophila yakuba]|uniref:Uncharacterized protein, isoform A n=1 Tax=Drosophila yakuba TaxID=7245 RepID=B4P8C9_DROYA|nr:protein FAM76B [Drosophila yakuba]XP_015052714.1 protein FAM76B [Drosophila yakuba]EDW91169.1 uncharacterized protein Dyak_GE13665, isoform A [Drosophila yakuba]KRJ99685.1 uncharacterized protein Dyak_GE13665, isoform B [Drosophila yakuba]
METPDYRLYMCTVCFQRCYWSDLSKKELRCIQCRLPPKICVICDKKFEPREKSHVYCKRCNFYILRHAAVKPPSLEENPERVADAGQDREGSSFTERWKEIKAAAGIVDDGFSD